MIEENIELCKLIFNHIHKINNMTDKFGPVVAYQYRKSVFRIDVFGRQRQKKEKEGAKETWIVTVDVSFSGFYEEKACTSFSEAYHYLAAAIRKNRLRLLF